MLRLVDDSPDLKDVVLKDLSFTGRRIGAGVYSSIEEVVLSGAICAAKTFHVTLQDFSHVSEAEMESEKAQFVQELQLVSTLRHPNVVQFLGVFNRGPAHLPALVIERMTCSLHDLLENNLSATAKPLVPLPVKCSILHNVASGLAYLHHRSPPVIHGNLSARNILLDSSARAKIADVRAAAPFIQHLRTAEGTAASKASVYMAPEAYVTLCNRETFKKESLFSSSVDIFFLGVIAIFTLGETFPCEPLNPTYTDQESGLVKCRSELERRNQYLQPIRAQLSQGHPLMTLITSCLCDNPEERPAIGKVLVLTEEARATYPTEGEYGMKKLELIKALQSGPENKVSTLEAKDREISELKQQLQSCLLEKKALSPKLDTKPAILLPVQSDREQSLSSERGDLSTSTMVWSTVESSVTRSVSTSDKTLRVQCYHQKPIKLKSISRGSAAIDGNFAYLVPCNSNTVFRYNAINGEGMEFPNSLCQNSAVVTVDSRLVLIGGDSEGHVTNKVLTLHYTGQWVEEYPPMNLGRSHCAAVCVSNGKFREHVIVIGGTSEDGPGPYTCDTQFLNTVSKSWYSLTSLPQSLCVPSATLCGNKLYVIGGHSEVYSSSIQALTSYNDDESQPPPASLVWEPLPHVPVIHSALATLRGQVVLIGDSGGEVEGGGSAIRQLVGGEEWMEIGCTLVPRKESLTVCPSPDKVIILGGIGAGNSVELCNAD